MPGIAQALAASGIGVAILTDDPAYNLRKLLINAVDGPLHISLYAAWDATHYAADAIREFVRAFTAHTAAAGTDGPPYPAV